MRVNDVLSELNLCGSPRESRTRSGGREGGRAEASGPVGGAGGGHRQEHERKKSLGFPQMHKNIEPLNLIHTPGPDSGSGGGGGFLATSVLPIENYFL